MMEKPQCLCDEVMVFLMDNKVDLIWVCPKCGRLLWRSKISNQQRWYVPEARILGTWRLE